MSTDTLPPQTSAPPPQRRRWSRPLVVVLVTIAIAAGLLLATMTLAALAGRTTDTSREVVTAPVDTLEIDVESGRVVVEAGDSDDIEVTATRRWALWAQPTVSTEVLGGTLRVAGDCPAWFVSWCETSVRVRAPEDVTVVADSDAGTIDVRGTAADVDASTSAGNITVDDVAGAVALHTSAGSIDARGLHGDSIEARTSAGNVTLDVESAPRRIEAESDAGSVDVAVPDGSYDVLADTSVGQVRVDVVSDPSADRTILARTSAGNVTVRGR